MGSKHAEKEAEVDAEVDPTTSDVDAGAVGPADREL